MWHQLMCSALINVLFIIHLINLDSQIVKQFSSNRCMLGWGIMITVLNTWTQHMLYIVIYVIRSIPTHTIWRYLLYSLLFSMKANNKILKQNNVWLSQIVIEVNHQILMILSMFHGLPQSLNWKWGVVLIRNDLSMLW